MFEGIWIPMVTPLRAGAPDLPAAAALARHLAGSGIAGLVLNGTTGEAAALAPSDTQALFETVRAALGPQVPVLMGISGSATAAMVATVRQWDKAGIDGFLVSAPSYVRPAQAGIVSHFHAVADATGLPIVIYNIPYRVGVNIDVPTLATLARHPQLQAVKESGGGSLAQLTAILDETPLRVLCGEDALLFPALCLGAHGAIAASAHLAAGHFVRLWQAVRDQQLHRARMLDRQLRPLIHAAFAEPNPVAIKAALAQQGWTTDEVHLPHLPAGPASRSRLATVLAAFAKETHRL
ncbi:4-hydroxy-tetrahydrodipicolinate synthase [Chitiniphilus purpureus]|uniref:4-hydroxy-tetrahydrodipicolinate synthase n=1 Tax=Chitiniphilus purpureus TaxID=2981137 RepID=A0ABY6DKM1_9NEIS|nr:4-hydroxy-tetrahydrodipicolinate synthase [Chitiniphilus sp. CD1]UXY14006.1 4-hydroxy-tetrahydrodipicolinate synthase [Chitiniphilus sp. CD1]